MQKDPLTYIESLQLPELSFANSELFQQEVDRVTAKFEQKDKLKPKKKEAFVDPPKKLIST
jgi:hypothetical protein